MLKLEHFIVITGYFSGYYGIQTYYILNFLVIQHTYYLVEDKLFTL